MRRAGWLRGRYHLGLPGLVLVCVVACTSSRKELSSPDPLERSLAVVRLAEAGDAGAVHELVDLLEDSDRAVRMYAIMGLRRLCGEDYGYRYYAGDGERAAAVRRWRDALRAGEVVVRTRPVPAPAEAEVGEPGEEPGEAGDMEEHVGASGRP